MASTKRILEHSGASSSTYALVVLFASGDLPEVLRQAEEKSLKLKRGMHAMTQAAADDQMVEGLVRSVVATELSAHIQEQQKSSIERPLPGRELPAFAPAKNGTTCVVCFVAPRSALLLFPCKRMVMCAECTKAVFTSSCQPQCPVCRSRIAECVYSVFL
jgi:Sec-independent protein translocase protein TatA